MPEVDIEKLEKEAEAKKAAELSVEMKVIDGKSYYKMKLVNKWFDSYDDCLKENQSEKSKQDNAAQGLNEFGQTKQQVEQAKAKAELLAKKANIFEEIAKLDAKIAAITKEKKTKKD